MISFNPGEIVVLFDGTVAVGGCARDGVINGQRFRTWNLTLQSMKNKKAAGEAITDPSELFGPEIFLAFKTEASIDTVIAQLTKLKNELKGEQK